MMEAHNATTDAPDIAHRLADLEGGEVIGYDSEKDIFGIKMQTQQMGDVATRSALREGYIVTRMGSHPDDGFAHQVQFQNIAEK